MATEWYLMDEYPIYNGGFEGDEFTAYAQQGFQEMLDTTMLCDNVEFITSDFTTIDKGQAVIQNVTSDTQIKADERQILAPVGTLAKYSYVRFEGDVWLIASEPSNNKFYEKAVLKICHNQLIWQDKVTKQIYKYYYWSEDTTRYSSGTYMGSVIIKFDKQYHIMIPADTATTALKYDMRFMLEIAGGVPLVFKLTKFDGITGNNQNVKLLNITLTENVYDAKRDNAELMIADYYEDESVPVVVGCKIDYESDKIPISSQGRFFANFGTNTEIGANDFQWQISDNDFNISNLILSYDGYQIRIIVKNNKELIGKHFTLAVVYGEEVYAKLDVEIIALW